MKLSKGPAQVSRVSQVAVVHVNWTGSLAEKKRLLLRAGFWHLCKGMGADGMEKQLKASGQWFDAEGLADGRRGNRKPRIEEGQQQQQHSLKQHRTAHRQKQRKQHH
jgi:hypothetical protein